MDPETPTRYRSYAGHLRAALYLGVFLDLRAGGVSLIYGREAGTVSATAVCLALAIAVVRLALQRTLVIATGPAGSACAQYGEQYRLLLARRHIFRL